MTNLIFVYIWNLSMQRKTNSSLRHPSQIPSSQCYYNFPKFPRFTELWTFLISSHSLYVNPNSPNPDLQCPIHYQISVDPIQKMLSHLLFIVFFNTLNTLRYLFNVHQACYTSFFSWSSCFHMPSHFHVSLKIFTHSYTFYLSCVHVYKYIRIYRSMCIYIYNTYIYFNL